MSPLCIFKSLSLFYLRIYSFLDYHSTQNEVWFPSTSHEWKLCNGRFFIPTIFKILTASGEDPTCSDSLGFYLPGDHLTYLDIAQNLQNGKGCGGAYWFETTLQIPHLYKIISLIFELQFEFFGLRFIFVSIVVASSVVIKIYEIACKDLFFTPRSNLSFSSSCCISAVGFSPSTRINSLHRSIFRLDGRGIPKWPWVWTHRATQMAPIVCKCTQKTVPWNGAGFDKGFPFQ